VHDVLDPRDLVPDEAEQLATSGYAVGRLATDAREAAAEGDLDRLAGIEAALGTLVRDEGWPFDEPTDEVLLRETAAAVEPVPTDASSLPDRVRGAWLGRAVGNTLGKPIEGLTRAEVVAGDIREPPRGGDGRRWVQAGHAGRERLQEREVAAKRPLAGVASLHPSAPIATAGRFTDVPRDDDLDWTILNLHLLERHGRAITTEQIAAGWLDRMPFTQTYTAERAAYRNLVQGLRAPATATTRNPYREWIGALIRGDAFGMVSPGDPGEAARLALVDARLSHVANGLYGELWAAALVAAALAADSIEAAMEHALRVVPTGSRLAEVLSSILRLHSTGVGHVAALDWVDRELSQYSWVHTLNNAALIAIALLWGRTFIEAAGISVAGGRDTDSTTATVGCVHGALHGAPAIPPELLVSMPVRVRSAVRDFDRIAIDELADRTLALAPAR
jgi:ADP-ribosylglycohydrolase